MKESIQIVENMNAETKFNRAEIRLKIKDIQIGKLQEQIQFRDELIDEARKIIRDTSAGPPTSLTDDRILTIDQVMYDNKAIYESLNTNRNQNLNTGTSSPRRQNYGSNAYGMQRRGVYGQATYIDRQDRLDQINRQQREQSYNARAGGYLPRNIPSAINRNHEVMSSKQSLNINKGGYIVQNTRNSMGPSKAFLYNKQAQRNASN